MTRYFPIVVERESSGAFSAYVIGLPVYAAADTRAQAERSIATTLDAYLEAHPDAKSTGTVRVARVTGGAPVRLVGPGALIASRTSVRKAQSARQNGRLGGRPRKHRAA